MLTTGWETSGYSRIDSRSVAMTPTMSSSSDSTVANTGRRIDSSDMFMAARSGRRRRFGHGRATGSRNTDLPHRRAVAQLQRAFHHDMIAGGEAVGDLHKARFAASELHFTLAHHGAVDHIDELPRLFRHQRLLGNHQRLPALLRQVHRHEHS